MRSVTVSYPVPFIFAGFLAVFFFSFTGAAVLREPMNWLFAATGLMAFMIATGIALYGILMKPDLLRSERHEQALRLMELFGDKEMDQATRAQFMTAVLGDDRKPRGRLGTRMGEHNG